MYNKVHKRRKSHLWVNILKLDINRQYPVELEGNWCLSHRFSFFKHQLKNVKTIPTK